MVNGPIRIEHFQIVCQSEGKMNFKILKLEIIYMYTIF